MKCKISMTILAILASLSAEGQVLSSEDSLMMNNASKTISQYLADEVKGRDYILYYVGDNIRDDFYLILIQQQDDRYDEYFIKNDSMRYQSRPIGLHDTVIRKMFTANSYHEGLRNLSNFDFKNLDLRPTYFYFCDKDGKIYGESFANIYAEPTPIDEGIYSLLYIKFLHQIQNVEEKQQIKQQQKFQKYLLKHSSCHPAVE